MQATLGANLGKDSTIIQINDYNFIILIRIEIIYDKFRIQDKFIAYYGIIQKPLSIIRTLKFIIVNPSWGCGYMIAGIFDRLFKRKPKPPEEEMYGDYSEVELPPQGEPGYEGEPGFEGEAGYDMPQFLDVPSDLEMRSRIYYGMDALEYRLKLHNKSSDMLGDITAVLKAPRKTMVDIVGSKQVVEMLDPGKSTTMKFKLNPKYVAGKSSLYGKIEYFDFKSKERVLLRLPQAYVDFEFKQLKHKRIDEDKWRLLCAGTKHLEIETETLASPPDKVFDIFKNAMNNLGLFMLPPIENVNLYRGIAKFYGYDDNDNKYAVETQVIGDKAKAKVLFRIWSNEPKTAMALAYKTLDIIDGAIKIKEFILKK